jgi:hypothetical protein
MVENADTEDCERCLIYPVKINSISREENTVIIDVDSLEELVMIATVFKKPLLHNETHYLIIFDKDIHYRTKNVDF